MSVGIGEADLKAAVESRLRSAGVRIAAGFDVGVVVPHLFVHVTAPTGPLGLFDLWATLSQFVKPWRPDTSTAPTLVLGTWHKERGGMVSNGNPVIPTRELVEKIIDEFAGDFLKANQKP